MIHGISFNFDAPDVQITSGILQGHRNLCSSRRNSRVVAEFKISCKFFAVPAQVQVYGLSILAHRAEGTYLFSSTAKRTATMISSEEHTLYMQSHRLRKSTIPAVQLLTCIVKAGKVLPYRRAFTNVQSMSVLVLRYLEDQDRA